MTKKQTYVQSQLNIKHIYIKKEKTRDKGSNPQRITAQNPSVVPGNFEQFLISSRRKLSGRMLRLRREHVFL